MKKAVLIFVVLAISTFGYGYDIERVDLGEGRFLNYVFSTDYKELEDFAAKEFGIRINIGQTSSWDDNTENNSLATQIRSLMRQYTQQGRYNSFSMAIFTDNYGDVSSVFVNWCYREQNTGTYKYMTTYWYF